jgi:protein-tyrosine phosphatase
MPGMSSDLPAHIKLENASNLRDLGGWLTEDGRRVRSGVVFRAPALVALSEADEQTIAALGIRTVCDFRGMRESDYNPVRIGRARHEKLPIEPSVGAGLKDILRTGVAAGHATPEDLLELLRVAYQAYALESFSQYRAMFELLLAEDALPLLFHCSAGKDRTGFGAALLLTALGVGWDDVLADYLATNRLWRREIAGFFDMPKALKDTLLSAHASLLSAAFSAVNGAYGSVDAYLEQAIGLDGQRRADLRARLTA